MQPRAGAIHLGASHLHRAEQHRGQVDALGRPVAPPPREVLQARDRRRRVVDYPAEPFEASAGSLETRIGPQRGDAQRDHVERMVEVVRQPGGDHAHGVHAFFVHARLPVAQPIRFAARLLGDVVAEHHHRAAGRGGKAFQPQLQRPVAALEAAGAHRILAAQQLARLAADEMPQRRVAHLPDSSPDCRAPRDQ